MTDFLQNFADWVVYEALGISEGSQLAAALNFFVYDSIKIILLLSVMIFIMGIVRTYISQEKIRNSLTGKREGIGNILASAFGALTPFCSCSSIPIFMSFLEAGVPLGVAFSFIITSPLVNEYVAILMLGFFGVEVTVAYIAAGMLIGVIFGMLIGKLKMEKHIVKDIFGEALKKGTIFCSFRERAGFGFRESKTIVTRLWLWILVGVGIGAVIHGYVPEELIDSIVSSTGVFSVPLAVAVGIPIYANCSAIVPIAVVLFQKGTPLGAALAFMMATAALSLPEAIILRRVMKLKLLALFFGLVAVGIILIGYIFNILF